MIFGRKPYRARDYDTREAYLDACAEGDPEKRERLQIAEENGEEYEGQFGGHDGWGWT